MPEEVGEIVANYPNGTKLKVPSEFFIVRKPKFSILEEVKLWLSKRNKQISDSPNRRAFGVAIADPLDDLEKQLRDAMSFNVVELNLEKTVGQLAKEIEHWLNNNSELAE